jgi:hypothetical protein
MAQLQHLADGERLSPVLVENKMKGRQVDGEHTS